MNSIETLIVNEFPKEEVILEEISVELVNDGVQVYVRSPLLAAFVEKVSSGTFAAEDVWGLRGVTGVYHKLAGKFRQQGHNHVQLFVTDPETGRPTASLFWLGSKDLAKGYTFIIGEPVQIPADLQEYLILTCEEVKKYYMRNIRKGKLFGRVVEKRDE